MLNNTAIVILMLSMAAQRFFPEWRYVITILSGTFVILFGIKGGPKPLVQYVYEHSPQEEKTDGSIGWSPTYRDPAVRETGLMTTIDPNIHTLKEMIIFAYKKFADQPMIGTKTPGPTKNHPGIYNFKDYKTIISKAHYFGVGLDGMRVPNLNGWKDPKYAVPGESAGDKTKSVCALNLDYNQNMPLRFISVFAPNIEPWYVIDIACMLHGLTLAPLYDTLGPKTIAYVLN